jgi:hypothetical protein
VDYCLYCWGVDFIVEKILQSHYLRGKDIFARHFYSDLSYCSKNFAIFSVVNHVFVVVHILKEVECIGNLKEPFPILSVK